MTDAIKYSIVGVLLAVLIFFAGRWTKDCTEGKPNIILNDTLGVQQNNFLPGVKPDSGKIVANTKKENVDSISAYWNKFWADSLGDMYGRGSFEVVTRKEDKYGTREYHFVSRTPLDPEGTWIIDENLNLPVIYPKSTIGLFAGIENRFDRNVNLFAGLKYYVIDTKHFQLYAKGSVNYQMLDKKFDGRIALQTELKL